MTAPAHIPVMRDAVLHYLAPRDGGIYVDGTFGAGGYSAAILAQADCTVWAIDRDPDAIAAGKAMANQYRGRLSMVHGRFGDMQSLLASRGVTRADGVAFDFGVSSMQLDQAERGFSFRGDGPLDMRMEKTGRSAADIVNHASEEELADILYHYGEERQARRIARVLVHERAIAPITTTQQLAGIIHKIMGDRAGRIDAATRTFQALRIAVNDELDEIDRGLDAAESLLSAGGRLVAVTFHSMEDRRVKQFLKQRSEPVTHQNRYKPASKSESQASFRVLTRKAVTPTEQEITGNPRARSAKLRAAERTEWLRAASDAQGAAR